jgi:hypothetical protein
MYSSNTSRNVTHTFRVQAKHWIPQVLEIIFGLILVVVGLEFVYPNRGGFIGLAICLFIVVIEFETEALPMFLSYLVIDNRGLTGRIDRYFYEIYWGEIVATNLIRNEIKQFYNLWIATLKGNINIPLKNMDVEQIWQLIRDSVSSEVWGDEAYKNWLESQEFYQELVYTNAKLIQSVDEPLRARQKRWLVLLGWSNIAMFGGFTAFSLWFDMHWIFATIFILFAMMASVLAFPDTVEMDVNNITRIIWPYGRFQMRWDEVERIEYSENGDKLVFYGKGKRLPMLGPRRWSEKGGADLSAMLRAQIQQRKIETRFNRMVYFVFLPKNTRLRRSKRSRM